MRTISIYTFSLLCGAAMLLAGCKDSTGDLTSGGTTEPETPSDNRPFPQEQHMDKTVVPGDNFFMYANGTYWNNTVVGENDVQAIIMEAGKTLASYADWSEYDALNQSFENAFIQGDTAGKAIIRKRLEQIEACQDLESLYRLTGRLWKEGALSPMRLSMTHTDEQQYELYIDLNYDILCWNGVKPLPLYLTPLSEMCDRPLAQFLMKDYDGISNLKQSKAHRQMGG